MEQSLTTSPMKRKSIIIVRVLAQDYGLIPRSSASSGSLGLPDTRSNTKQRFTLKTTFLAQCWVKGYKGRKVSRKAKKELKQIVNWTWLSLKRMLFLIVAFCSNTYPWSTKGWSFWSLFIVFLLSRWDLGAPRYHINTHLVEISMNSVPVCHRWYR